MGRWSVTQWFSQLSLKVTLQGTIRNDDFLRNTALQCWNNVATIWTNVATMEKPWGRGWQQCCTKNRRCESSRVTSPLPDIYLLEWAILRTVGSSYCKGGTSLILKGTLVPVSRDPSPPPPQICPFDGVLQSDSEWKMRIMVNQKTPKKI